MSSAAASVPGPDAVQRHAMWDPDRTYFFLHVMKTGGTSMLRHIIDNFPVGQVEPDVRVKLARGEVGEPEGPPTYGSLERILSLSDERRREIRVYAGHYPFMVTDLVPTDVTMTVLRDPVERTISFLRHCKRYDPTKRPLSLEEIYDGPYDFPLLIRNYQTKLFAMRPTDEAPDKAHLADIFIDGERLEVAKANLASVDVIGLQHRFGEFLGQLENRYGWTFGAEHQQRVATEDWPVSASLRQRIVDDNQVDLEFLGYAEELCVRRAVR
jgi:hypothetical protein